MIILVPKEGSTRIKSSKLFIFFITKKILFKYVLDKSIFVRINNITEINDKNNIDIGIKCFIIFLYSCLIIRK